MHTVSLVALDARTGEKIWHYQQVPHDRWGYDVASPPVLFDVEHEGETVPAVGQASKLGWLFVHDRRDGKLLYLSEPFVPQENLFARPTSAGVRISPGTLGAVSWTPIAVNPETRTAFIPGIDQAAMFYTRRLKAAGEQEVHSYAFFQQADEDDRGLLTAIDTHDGKIRWQRDLPGSLVGGALATAGGLVFTGEGNGRFNAFDSSTGELLWQFRTDYGVNAPPVTYAVDGTQYIAVAAGGNSLFGYETGDEILVFSLVE
ncbi:MAG: PQQ-binding-like beta-propeller repeat protein [Gammaproteobacteria bacterium]|nr:PQQ-binding-like beta-propeller repeat protein [Gammaproteobacteria bacterium]